MAVRPYAPGDDRFWEIRGITYNDGQTIPEEKRVFKVARGYVAESNSGIEGIYSLLPMTCTRGEATLPCGAIAGVAVDPLSRRTGVGSRMMRDCVRLQREEGFPISALYPYREPFYRKAGYQTCGVRYRITCPAERLPKVEHGLPVRRIGHEEFAQLDLAFESFARKRSGLNIRTPVYWGSVLNERQAIYVAGDPVEAYAVIEHRTDFWVEQEVREFVWATPCGYETMLRVFSQASINKTAMVWHEPSDSPYLISYLDQGAKVESNRPIMYRITDVPASLRLLRTQGSGQFCIQISDDVIPENRGPWRVRFSEAGVEVERCDQAGVDCSIQQFTAGYLGSPSWADMCRNSMISGLSHSDHNALNELMPPTPVYNLEFF